MITLSTMIPNVEIFQHSTEGPQKIDISQYCQKGTTVLFGLPAAFSPTCSEQQLPSYINHADELRAAGVDRIACISVNDSFVMNAWGNSQSAKKSGVDMLADPSADFARATGTDINLEIIGLNVRSTRYAMVIKEGRLVYLAVEENPGVMHETDAETTLAWLKK